MVTRILPNPVVLTLLVVAGLAATAGATPNLAVDSASVLNGGQDFEPGDYADVHAVIRNDGTSTGTLTVGIYLSSNPVITSLDQLLLSLTVDGLGMGQAREVRQFVRLPSSLPEGYYYLGVIVDPIDVVVEWDEDDNSLAATPWIWVDNYTPVVVVHTYDYYYDGYWWSYDGYYYYDGYWYYYSGPYYDHYYYDSYGRDVHYYCAAVPGSDVSFGWLLLLTLAGGLFAYWRTRRSA